MKVKHKIESAIPIKRETLKKYLIAIFSKPASLCLSKAQQVISLLKNKCHLEHRLKIYLKPSLFLALILAFSCTQKTFNNEAALLDYIKDPTNGYTQHKTINGVNYTLTYRPTDVLVKQELGDNITDIKSSKREALRSKYKNYMYFNLSMSINNKELLSAAPKNRNEFGQMVNQLAFGMNKKVHVYTPSKDTLEMADFIYPRMYGMSRATTIMFVYPREKEKLKEDYLNFTIEDLGLYTGEVKFKILADKLKKEPSISFKN